MSQPEHTRPLQVGETVAYRWETLNSHGWYLRDFLRACGTVTALEGLPGAVFLRVAWDHPGLPTLLSPQELCRVEAPRRKASA